MQPISRKITQDMRAAHASETVHTINTKNNISYLQQMPMVIAAMPAFNEEKFIAKTVLGALKHVDRVLVVDDGSTDSTAEIAGALGAIVVKHKKNMGYGAALRTIFSTARSLQAEVLVILDADGQHDPHDIPKLLAPLSDGADVVIGSRFLEGDGAGIPVYRKVGMKVLDSATNFAGNIHVSDSQSGFRAYRKRAIDAIKLNGHNMSAGSEILIQLADHHMNIQEVPITVRYDIGDTSSENPLSHGLSVLSSLVGVLGYRRPLLSFGTPGVIFMAVGFIFASLAFSIYYETAQLPFALSMASGLFIIVGLVLATTALILNSLVQIIQIEGRKA